MMITTLIIAMHFLATAFVLVPEAGDGGDYYIDDATIARVDDGDTWVVNYSRIENGSRSDKRLLLQPQLNQYYSWDKSLNVDVSRLDLVPWKNMAENSTTSQIATKVMDVAGKQFSIQYIYSSLSSFAFGKMRDYMAKYRRINTSFASPPKAIGNGIYSMWVVDVPPNGIAASMDFSNYRTAEVLNRIEVNFRQNQFRVCEVIHRDAQGQVLVSQNGGTEWMHIVPNSLGESLYDYIASVRANKKRK